MENEAYDLAETFRNGNRSCVRTALRDHIDAFDAIKLAFEIRSYLESYDADEAASFDRWVEVSL